MNKLNIHRASTEHIDGSYAVIKECRDLLLEQGMDNWKRYTRDKVASLIRSNEMFILNKGDETIGTLKISGTAPSFYSSEDMEKWEEPKTDAFYFTALAVSPKYHGDGYGSKLLGYAENYTREHGLSYLRMTTFFDNHPLAKYYERKGFTFRQKRKIQELDLTLLFGEKRLN